MADYGYRVLHVVGSEQIDKRNRIDLVVAVWRKVGVPVLEKRRMYHTADGEDRPCKLVGLNADDFKLVLDNADRIGALLLQQETQNEDG